MTNPDSISPAPQVVEGHSQRLLDGNDLFITEAPVTIEEANRQSSEYISPGDQRKNKKLAAAGWLAGWLWFILGGVVGIHMLATVEFADILVTTESLEDKKTTQVEAAIGQVNDTAKTLYAFLGPLVAAVTGYYFSTSEDDNDSPE